jgi:hypothetical protein
MNKMTFILITAFCTASVYAGAVPNQITYQGTLKQQGIPVNGNTTMSFRLTNSDGTQAYWASGDMPVNVNGGLFSVPLSPSGVDWQNVVPYMEVSVQGQVLLPREQLTANAYALMSGGVTDGAITNSKIAAGAVSTQSLADGSVTLSKLDSGSQGYLVPSGLVAIFAGNCPSGWTRFTALDNLFPMGSSTYGATGGSATHTHSISMDGAHNHGGTTGASTVNDNNQWLFGNYQGSGSHSDNFADATHVHSIATDGAHNHGGATGPGSSLPPYMTVVFCQKQ